MRGPGYRTVLDLGYYSTLLFILTVILWSNGKTKAPTGFRWGKLKERDHMEDVRLRRGLGDNIVTDVREIGREDVNGINVAQDGDMWWSVVDIVMNLRVP